MDDIFASLAAPPIAGRDYRTDSSVGRQSQSNPIQSKQLYHANGPIIFLFSFKKREKTLHKVQI